jgi:hypothetical protein
MKGETESEIIATQDQALKVTYSAKYYYKRQQIANEERVNSMTRK